MDSIIVEESGPLYGKIAIAGAKNACLTLMPATLLSDEPLTLTNAPRLSDIGTMSLFRGLAYSFLEDSYYNKFPKFVVSLGSDYLFGYIPYAFLTFIILSIIFAFILHKTIIGKRIYSIGNNPESAQYTGIQVDKYTFVLFTLNGLFSAIAAIFLSGRLSSVRPNIAFGWELEIITMVVLGGVYIYGGSGSILGVVISIFILGMLSFGLGLINVPGVGIIIFTGLLLILSIGFPSFIKYFRSKNE